MQIQQSPITEQAPTFQNKAASTLAPGKNGMPASSPEKGSLSSSKGSDEKSMYLKVVSRLENLLQKEALPEKALKGFMKAVNARLQAAAAPDKKMVLNTPEAKALEIGKIEDFSEKIKEGLEGEENSSKVLALLKQPKFVELMNGQTKSATPVYGPDGKAAAMKKVPEVKIASSDLSGIGTDPKQALAALKSMQMEPKIPAEATAAVASA